MATGRLRASWKRLLSVLGLRRKPRAKKDVPAEPLPSSAVFLPYLPANLRSSQAGAAEALELIHLYGELSGSSEQHWLLDQILRRFTGEHYEAFIENWSLEEEFGLRFDWKQGSEPSSRPGGSSI